MARSLNYPGWLSLTLAASLSACGIPGEVSRGWTTSPKANVAMSEGPPIEDVVTAFDEALSCLRGKVRPEVIFAVGQVIDHTGKENYSEGGSGKFVSQGAGEMVQSALYRAGVSVVNRRDPNIAIVESNWGIRDIKRQVPVNFYISGSINSLDFIPGGGAEFSIAGIGPRYRQNRILIGLDLTMTDAYTGRVVGSVPLQKQIFAREVGVSAGRFFGETLVTMDAGGMEREAVHFALRQMLSLATFELLGQIMNPDIYDTCRAKVNSFAGSVSHTGTGDRNAMAAALKAAKEASAEALLVDVRNAQPPAPPAQPGQPQRPAAPAAPVAAAPQAGQRQAAAQPQGPTAQNLHRTAVSAAIKAISLAAASQKAATQKEAVQQSAESLRLANLSLITLKQAAAAGLSGDEGDAAAVVVQQAIEAARKAALAATSRQDAAAADPQPATPEATAQAPAPAAAAGAPEPGPTVPGTPPAEAAPAVPAEPQGDAVEPAAPTEPAANPQGPAIPDVPGTPAHIRKFGQ
ncbi:CsgG/HfaB family protein [Gemmobacter nectariphilus]|uniref:CsgG/HfaB family protein n=1 Tax=Gemmobacter nectariphilus TaxID=220343 RepID=UPI00041364EA|nr:CsgG/HfaB family protein [Gemmobacter nectariphilus]